MTRRLPILAAVLLSVALAASPRIAGAESPEPDSTGAEEGTDPLAVAAVLLDDGHLDRAARELDGIDPRGEGVDTARYWTLRGLVEMRRGLPEDAADALERALAAGQEDPLAWLLLARVRLEMTDWQGVLDALDGAGPAAWERPEQVLVRARALLELGRRAEAHEALVAGEARFPEAHRLTRRRIRLLVDLGLFREAAELGRRHLARTESEPGDWIAIAESLRRGRQPEEAARILEAARLHFPGDEQVAIALARAHLDAGRVAAAAQIFERASDRHPDLAADAVELYRRAGRPLRALYVNGRVRDPRAKTRQRLGILVDLGRFESVLSLAPRLSRLDLATEDPVRYALAYAGFRTGRFEEAERWLRGIADPVLFEKAAELRRAMASCEPAPWGCE